MMQQYWLSIYKERKVNEWQSWFNVISLFFLPQQYAGYGTVCPCVTELVKMCALIGLLGLYIMRTHWQHLQEVVFKVNLFMIIEIILLTLADPFLSHLRIKEEAQFLDGKMLFPVTHQYKGKDIVHLPHNGNLMTIQCNFDRPK